MSGKNLFYLMHNDSIVTTIEIDTETGNFTRIAPQANTELLPLGGNLNAEDLRKWWNRRAVPLSQGKIQSILLNHKMTTTQSLLVKNLGLSLIDHYWIKPINSELTWNKINLFTNNFIDEIGEMQFISSDSKNHCRSFYPSASLQGDLRKKWMIQKGKRYLVKGNIGASFSQSINEVIATNIHQEQAKMPYTCYKLYKVQCDEGAVIGCKCESFTSIHVEFVPAYDVVSSVKKKNDVSEFEHFIEICGKNGLDRQYVRDFLEYQILTDFLITNTDRHFYNFGILRDTNTLKFVDMAPIFDSGNSMFWNCPEYPKDHNLLNVSVNSFKRKEIELLKYIKNPKLIDLSKLPEEETIRSLICKDKMNGQYVEHIMEGYHKKRNLLEEFQSGKLIFEYKNILSNSTFAD